MFKLTNETYEILNEIIKNENNSDYWQLRFENSSNKERNILRGCF